jgi:enoyl-CoA hydratase/carnithine racemase
MRTAVDDESKVLVEIDGQIALVTINRPQQMNAIDAETSNALNQAFVEIECNADVLVTILTGAGDAFCAGADLKAIAAGELSGIIDAEPGGMGGLVRGSRRKPVIAAINGHALAGGFELVLACDLAVCVESAEFGLPEVTLGLIAAAGGLVRLPRQIPPKRAMEFVLTGSRISATEAHELGLVNRLVATRGEVIGEARRFAASICANAPLSVIESRNVAQVAIDDGAEAAWAACEKSWSIISVSHDAAEGPLSFAKRRPPVWSGD